MQHAGGMLLPPVQKLVATFIFALWGKNANRIPHPLPEKDHTIWCGLFLLWGRDSKNLNATGCIF